MIDLDFKYFFDRAHVANRISDGTRKALSKIGAYVRTDARSSMRRRGGKKLKSAQPGQPPSVITRLLKDRLFFFLDPNTDSVVIGPQLLPSSKRKGTLTVPELLEHGGTTRHWRTGKPAVYRAFPYMEPAFNRTLDKYPSFFEGTVTE